MNESRLATLEQIREFLAGTCDMAFAIPADQPRRRAFVAKVLRRFRYDCRPKGQRGVLFEYMQRLSGYSRQHLSRLIAQYRHRHSIEPASRASRTSFSRKYQPADVALLAQTDSWHDTLSGPATQVLLRRAFGTFGDPRYERLSQISVSHLYNLRASPSYLKQRSVWHGTRSSAAPIGIRKAPAPHGLPGYIRIDTVHQGDQDGIKGVYHINAVDIVTQWELVASVERISEAYLLPVIALLLQGFPFLIRGFHSDSGSEYINHEVAELLEKLRVEFTKSGPRHIDDNALAESKNGAVILDTLEAKGKIRKTYPRELIMTPFQRLQSIDHYTQHLKAGITAARLEHQATSMSNNQAAQQVQQARKRLFQSINRRSNTAA